jgi:hypothetical protein
MGDSPIMMMMTDLCGGLLLGRLIEHILEANTYATSACQNPGGMMITFLYDARVPCLVSSLTVLWCIKG